MTVDVSNHILVPVHTKISDAEKQKLYNTYNITSKGLPKIFRDDPALAKLAVEVGDIIKIQRQSKTAGVSTYYRVVVDG